jgi:hypothetical protein
MFKGYMPLALFNKFLVLLGHKRTF